MPREPSPALLILTVALGGAGGGCLRWALTEVAPDGSGIPWTTWWINVVGTAALTAVPVLLSRDRVSDERSRELAAAFLGPGLLGGFTTLSAYALVARGLLAGDSGDSGVVMVLLLLGSTLVASLLAISAVRRWAGGPHTRVRGA